MAGLAPEESDLGTRIYPFCAWWSRTAGLKSKEQWKQKAASYSLRQDLIESFENPVHGIGGLLLLTFALSDEAEHMLVAGKPIRDYLPPVFDCSAFRATWLPTQHVRAAARLVAMLCLCMSVFIIVSFINIISQINYAKV